MERLEVRSRRRDVTRETLQKVVTVCVLQSTSYIYTGVLLYTSIVNDESKLT